MPVSSASADAASKVITSWSVSQEYTTQQTDVTVQSAPGPGLRLVITHIFIQVQAAVDVLIEEGTTTLKWQFYGDAKGAGVAQNNIRIEILPNTLISITTTAVQTVSLTIGGNIERV